MSAQKTSTSGKFSAERIGLLPSVQQRQQQLPKRRSVDGNAVSDGRTKQICYTESSTSPPDNSSAPAAAKDEGVRCCTDRKSDDCPGNKVLDCRIEKSAPRPTCPPPIETACNGWPKTRVVCDEIGSGVIPHCCYPVVLEKGARFCCTPLTQYQMIHGEHARKILTNRICVRRNILRPPPCSVCHTALPLCRGYYREYRYSDDACYTQPVSTAKCNVSEKYWQQNWEGFGVTEPSVARLAAHSSGLVDRILMAKPGLKQFCTDEI